VPPHAASKRIDEGYRMAASLQLAALAGSAAMGTAIGLVAREVIRIVVQPRKDLSRDNLLEHQRRTILRQRSRFYRWLEPLVDRLDPLAHSLWGGRLPQLGRNLELAEPQTPWKASEYLIVRTIEAVPIALAISVVFLIAFGPLAALAVILAAMLALPVVAWRRAADRAWRYRIAVRNRLAFVVDLMALMLESGAIFRECLATAAAENEGDPVGEEFSRVCRAIDQGVPQTEAMRNLGQRIDDADVYEMVFAINTAEERGTHLKQTLSDLAEQMRHRRIQWLERAAEEAKIHITWPGLLVMVACLLIVAAPLLLSGWSAVGR
jgi:pilus assembly protein TadC